MYYSIYRTYDLSILFFSKTKQNNTLQLSNNPPSSTSHKSFLLNRSIFHALYFPLTLSYIHSFVWSLPPSATSPSVRIQLNFVVYQLIHFPGVIAALTRKSKYPTCI